MTHLDYHRMRQAEMESWSLRAIEAAVRAQDPCLPELLPVLDEEALCRRYLAATPEQRIWIRSRVNRSQSADLFAFAREAAVRAIRENRAEWIRLGLAAHAIENLSGGDCRENLMAVALLCHAAEHIAADAGALLSEAATTSGAGVCQLLLDFAARPPELRGIGVMGWREVETPAGIDFERW